MSMTETLKQMEAAAAKIKALESQLAAERLNAKTLVEQYRAQSNDVLKTLGLEDESSTERKPRKPRKARSHEAILMSTASRSIRQSAKSGEKNAKTILAAALEAAEKTAKGKLSLSELPADIKAKIEAKVKSKK